MSDQLRCEYCPLEKENDSAVQRQRALNIAIDREAGIIVDQQMKQVCLKCEKEFIARGTKFSIRFIRLCDNCKNFVKYKSNHQAHGTESWQETKVGTGGEYGNTRNLKHGRVRS